MKILKIIATLLLINEVTCILPGGEASDCTRYYNFIKGDSKYYNNDCCSDPNIVCDNEGYIKSIIQIGKIPDYNSFPFLSRIEEIQFEISGLKEIPNILLNLTTLKILNLIKNEIEIIPPTIQNLSKLEELNLSGNIIKELPTEIFNLTNLKLLDLTNNNVEVVSPDIQNLSHLENLYLGNNNIQQLPNELFNLTHLKILYINNNRSLTTKIINFGNSALEQCGLNNINILCYEPHTCNSIKFKDKTFSDAEAEKYIETCPSNYLNKDDDDKESSSTIIIILGCSIIILIGIIVTFIFIKKNKFKICNKSDFSFTDKLETEGIINSNQSNSSNNSTDNEINNNNNNSNNDTQNNLDHNKTIMVNLNDMMKDIYKDESYSFSYSLSF